MTDQPVVQPTPPAPKPVIPRSPQDQKMADRIADAREKILIAQADRELTDRLATRGFTPDRLLQGLALQDEAQQTFNARQVAMGEEDTANANFAATLANCRRGFTDFRTTSRKIFKKNPAALAHLGVTGRVPVDAQKFVTAARASYAAAQTTPGYLAELSQDGYTFQG